MGVSKTGLLLNVYKWSLGDCSNGGVSSRCNKLTLVGIVHRTAGSPDVIEPLPMGAGGPFAPEHDSPAVVLVYRNVMGRSICHVEPLDSPSGKFGYMAGGAFVNGDSRFSRLTGFYGAASLHDRTEG